MENFRRNSVIKNIKTWSTVDNSETKHSEIFESPTKAQYYKKSSSLKQISPSFHQHYHQSGVMSLYDSNHLLLPPILTFAHLSYPSTAKYAEGLKEIDFLPTYPPLLGFNNNEVHYQHQYIPKYDHPDENPKNRIYDHREDPMIKKSPPVFQEITKSAAKKGKFDFSIEALTSTHNVNKESTDLSPSAHIVKKESEETSVLPKFQEERSGETSAMIIKNRGRPSADSIEILKQKSLENPHRYNCTFCGRSFPRKKSLDTHKLTHSDIKPYACDFPGCNRKFKQSGQLKTHVRLHTGEKPFKCTYPNCESAFTHANRKCSLHPSHPLQRISSATPETVLKSLYVNDNTNMLDENFNKVKEWYRRQFTEKESKVYQSNENPAPTVNVSEKIPSEKKVLRESNDENCKRLLSAVALVELHDQTEKLTANEKENYQKLFGYPSF